jgi:DnaJ like chaperone protein
MTSWTGRIIGFLIGMFFIGPLAGVIGAVLGYIFIDKPRQFRRFNDAAAQRAFTTDANYNRNLIHHTFALMGYVARGAGRVNQQHIATAERLMRLMQLDASSKQMAIEAFNYGKSPEFDVRALTSNLRNLCQGNLSLISYLLEIQVQMALSDGTLENLEHQRLLEIASLLGIRSEAMERLIRQRIAEMYFSQNFNRQYQNNSQGGYQQSSDGYQQGQGGYNQGNDGYNQAASQTALNHAYEVLGVSRDAPLADINRAYKRLMLKYHPDRLKAQNLSPELVKVYEEKAKDIQAAYDLIKRSKRED